MSKKTDQVSKTGDESNKVENNVNADKTEDLSTNGSHATGGPGERLNYELGPKKRNWKKISLFIAIPLLLLIVAAGSYATHLYKKAESAMDNSYVPVERDSTRFEKQDEFVQSKNPGDISVLFLGVDESDVRQDTGSRTDAMILATFNEAEKSVKLLSIPRDSYVSIPDRDQYTKINHAHSYGGVSLTIDTVEELLDIPIDYYVKMNFNAFMEVVEAIGGVEANVPYEIKELDSKDRKQAVHLMPGWQRLDGEETLAFVRTRKQDSDFMRGQRQQEILHAIIDKMMSVSSINKYGSVIDAIGDNMTTDLAFNDMKMFIEYARAGKNLNVESLNLKGSDTYIDRIYYYLLDEEHLEETKLTLKRHLNITVGNQQTDYVESQQDYKNATNNNSDGEQGHTES